MRAYEFISENRKVGKLPAAEDGAATELVKMRDDGFDRANHLNRVMMAAAMHDGKTTNPVEMDSYSWAERFNTGHPYTKEESNMLKGAIKTVGGQHNDLVRDSHSNELDDTHRVSPVKGFKGYPRGRK